MTQKALLGFASGVMIAAGVWSLIMPSIEMAEEQGTIPWLPAAVGFLLGIAFLLALDTLIPHLHVNDEKPEGPASNLKKSTMLVLAVTLHNIPEGMAVGVVFAGAMMENSTVSMAGAIALAIGIAIQNFPEGAIISMPLKSQGMSKSKAFLYGGMSGVVEPISAVITILLADLVVPVLPYLLSFAAGGNDLCGCGGTDSGIPGWRTFQYWNNWCCNRICNYDDFRCGTRIKTYKKGKIANETYNIR